MNVVWYKIHCYSNGRKLYSCLQHAFKISSSVYKIYFRNASEFWKMVKHMFNKFNRNLSCTLTIIRFYFTELIFIIILWYYDYFGTYKWAFIVSAKNWITLSYLGNISRILENGEKYIQWIGERPLLVTKYYAQGHSIAAKSSRFLYFLLISGQNIKSF